MGRGCVSYKLRKIGTAYAKQTEMFSGGVKMSKRKIADSIAQIAMLTGWAMRLCVFTFGSRAK
jgi:hypothetical protein